MARHKDEQWVLTDAGTPNGTGGRSYQISTIQLALLMDIRDELKALNALFRCHNFLQIPNVLRGIRAKLPTRRRKKKVRARRGGRR